MISPRTLYALVLAGGCLVGPLPAGADQTITYRDPGEMTVEERMNIMRHMSDYQGCTYRESMARVESFPDIRQAADEGMTACRSALDDLKETIAAYRFSPEFGEQFARHAQSRAVKMLLPELSLKKGAR